MVHPSQKNTGFGKRKELPKIIIAKGDRFRTFTIRPWLLGAALAALATFCFGYLGATGYLLFRDDILDGTRARQAEIQYAYEDRIALLRSEIDRVTSRHLVETQSIENQIGTLLDRQDFINRRQLLLEELIARARAEGIDIAGVPRPNPRPNRAIAASPDSTVDNVVTGTIKATDEASDQSEPENQKPLLKDVQSALDEAEANQIAVLDYLRSASDSETRRLIAAMRRLGMNLPQTPDTTPFSALGNAESASGGPFVPVDSHGFIEKVAALDDTLAHLHRIRSSTAALPLRTPIPGAKTTSRFGRRMDPFLRRPAMHSGVDFRAGYGTPVRATAPGKVIYAGHNGGYGRMVEIRHAHGLTTRYAHMSRISVKKGATVEAGSIVGRVGSTGRSTGPHLHYETRRNGKAVNPNIYLSAGQLL